MSYGARARAIRALPQEELGRLFALPLKKAARELGIACGYWHRLSRALGRPAPRRGGPYKIDPAKLTQKQINDIEELSAIQCAKIFNVDPGTVRNARLALEKAGKIPRRAELREESQRLAREEVKRRRQLGDTWKEIGQDFGYTEAWARNMAKR